MFSEQSATKDNGFNIVHHRKLNSLEGIEQALQASKELPDYQHTVEGDLCWAEVDGEIILYFYHPTAVINPLKPQLVKKMREEGMLWELKDALDSRYSPLNFIVELKWGYGSREAAIAKAVKFLLEKKKEKFWIDCFSLRDLKLVKKANPKAKTSLHTKLVIKNYALKSAVEFPPLSICNLKNEDAIDIATLTYKSSLQRLINSGIFTTEKTVEILKLSGKELVYGGVKTKELFNEVKDKGVKGGYIKFPWQKIKN